MEHRKVKILRIDVCSLVNSGKLSYDGISTRNLFKFSGIPEDAQFLGMAISNFGNSLDILLWSEEFDPVEEAEAIPHIDLLVTKEGADTYRYDYTESDAPNSGS